VIDEAHYFLHEPDAEELLDLTLGAYTLVTYRMSDLSAHLRNAIESVIVKRTTEPRELQALMEIAGAKNDSATNETTLASLNLDEGVLMPGIEEAAGKSVKFKLYPRLTSHVRHKAKYLDVQLMKEQGFVFTENGKTIGKPARTLNEFVSGLASFPPSVISGHALRGDFSQWIGDVFRDHFLASDIRKLEQRHRIGHVQDLTDSLIALIQERYDISPERIDASTNSDAGLAQGARVAAR